MNVKSIGRVSLVTGGTEGIGRAVALQLARGGDRVLFVGRSAERGAAVLAALREANPRADHAYLRADLSLLSETASVALRVQKLTRHLDAVVCCAGILSMVPEWTAEGLERSFVLNYLSRYLLARRLIPMLMRSRSGRIVLVANAGKYKDTLDFADLQHRRGKPGLAVAGRTQFANDLLATELAARLRDTLVEVTCVYPGIVDTGVMRNARGLPAIARLVLPWIQRLIGSTAEAAAETPVFLAQDLRAVGSGGRFYGPQRSHRVVPRRALQIARRTALWAASEALAAPYLQTPAEPSLRFA